MANHLISFREYTQVNEAFDLGFFRGFPMFRRALTDPFMLKLSVPIIKLMNADINDPTTWEDPYRRIFRHACLKFGGARKPEINTTCDKGKALMGLAKHLFDPSRGLIRKQDIDRWVSTTVKDTDPEKKPVRWPYSAQEIDSLVMKFVDVLERTKVKPTDLKEVGTFLLGIALPIMSKFYKKTDLQKMKMITSGKLITPSLGLDLASNKAEGETEAPGVAKGKPGEITIY